LTLTKAPVAVEAELDLQPYRQFVELWRNILEPVDLKYSDLDAMKQKQLITTIYDQFMHCLLMLIDKLDLTYVNVSTQACENNLDPKKSSQSHQHQTDSLKSRNVWTIRPNSSGDFDTFINLVELTGILLLECHVECFKQWVFLFSKKIVRSCDHLPMVGGFYKLLELTMVLCDRLDFFQSISNSSDDSSVQFFDLSFFSLLI
jgi:hypothetical protein